MEIKGPTATLPLPSPARRPRYSVIGGAPSSLINLGRGARDWGSSQWQQSMWGLRHVGFIPALCPPKDDRRTTCACQRATASPIKALPLAYPYLTIACGSAAPTVWRRSRSRLSIKSATSLLILSLAHSNTPFLRIASCRDDSK